jgi:hypothetical protein
VKVVLDKKTAQQQLEKEIPWTTLSVLYALFLVFVSEVLLTIVS